jgi:hypothetical protein
LNLVRSARRCVLEEFIDDVYKQAPAIIARDAVEIRVDVATLKKQAEVGKLGFHWQPRECCISMVYGLPWFRNMSWWSSTFFPLSVSDFVGIAELSFLARLDSGK